MSMLKSVLRLAIEALPTTVELRTNLSRLNSELDNMRSKLSEAERYNHSLFAQKETLEKALDKAGKQFQELMNTHRTLEADADRLREEVAAFANQHHTIDYAIQEIHNQGCAATHPILGEEGYIQVEGATLDGSPIYTIMEDRCLLYRDFGGGNKLMELRRKARFSIGWKLVDRK